MAKQEFEASEDIQIEEEYQEVEAELIVEESLKPSRFWVRVLLFALGLFSIAVIAQSVQWLIDTFQARQWIYFAFAIVFALISLTGVVAIISEWRKLVFLRHHQQQRQVSEQLLLEELSTTSGEKAVNFCNEVVANLKMCQAYNIRNNAGKAN
ncbi:Uncharacterised protein [Actinobacillus equuli]|nr:Uncharacterised protein [Actinobacillus equuli]